MSRWRPHLPERRGGVLLWMLLAAALLVLAAGGVLAASAVGIDPSSSAVAQVAMPLGGGSIVHAALYRGPHEQSVPVSVRGDQIWPKHHIAVGETVVVDVTIKRPGWIGWLTGSSEHARLRLVAPSAQPSATYLTLAGGRPLRVSFSRSVASVAYGALPGHLTHLALAAPSRDVTLPRHGVAGSLLVSATPFTWEASPAQTVSWFPPGSRSAVLLAPAPGGRITPTTPLMLTFSEPIAKALGSSLPAVSPADSGGWRRTGTHTLTFQPSGYGYGLGAKVTIALPSGIRVVGGSAGATASTASWTVPAGSTLRLQQLLARLGYLPLDFHSAHGEKRAVGAEEQAAVQPPAGSFSWRYGDVPAALRSDWQQAPAGELTRAAVMAFESREEMTADGLAGPAVWRALIAASLADRRNGFGYSYVSVSKPAQHLSLWHDGHIVVSGAVNTGIASAPTEAGTFAVYEHLRSTTMSGNNPDGSHYEDHGVPWVSYFNGGDALHGFERASYGIPQSLGCVEMAPAMAGAVWPYTPIGTLVHIEA